MAVLAEAKARTAPDLVRESARHGWSSRWWSMLSVCVQDSLAATLVDDGALLLDGADGAEPPLGDVLLDGGLAPEVSCLPLRGGAA